MNADNAKGCDPAVQVALPESPLSCRAPVAAGQPETGEAAMPEDAMLGLGASWRRNNMAMRNLSLLGLLAMPLAAQSLEPPALSAAAQSVEVAAGPDVKLKFHFLAAGKQIYQCDNGAWAKASTPDAALYDMNSNLKGRHSAGPTWTMAGGEGAIKAIGSTA